MCQWRGRAKNDLLVFVLQLAPIWGSLGGKEGRMSNVFLCFWGVGVYDVFPRDEGSPFFTSKPSAGGEGQKEEAKDARMSLMLS